MIGSLIRWMIGSLISWMIIFWRYENVNLNEVVDNKFFKLRGKFRYIVENNVG